MLDRSGFRPAAGGDHIVADRRHLEELRRKRIGQPDAAVGGGVTGHNPGMHRRTRPGKPVHPRHRRAAVYVGVMPPRLLHDREGADEGRMLRGSGRHRRGGDEARAAINVDLLLPDGDDNNHRLLVVDIDDQLVGRLGRVLLLAGFGRQRGYRQGECRNAQPQCRNSCCSCGDRDRLYPTHTLRFQCPSPCSIEPCMG